MESTIQYSSLVYSTILRAGVGHDPISCSSMAKYAWCGSLKTCRWCHSKNVLTVKLTPKRQGVSQISHVIYFIVCIVFVTFTQLCVAWKFASNIPTIKSHHTRLIWSFRGAPLQMMSILIQSAPLSREALRTDASFASFEISDGLRAQPATRPSVRNT